MVTTRGATAIRKLFTPYRSPPNTTATATPTRSKTARGPKTSSSTPETPVKKRKCGNAHIRQTPPPKLRFNLQKEIEAEAGDELKSPGSSVQPGDVWIFSDNPIMTRRDTMKDDTDNMRIDISPRSDDEEEAEEMVELPQRYMSKRVPVMEAPFAHEDDWATEYESDGDVPTKLGVSRPKLKLDTVIQCQQWQEKLCDDRQMMSDSESVLNDPNYLTIVEDEVYRAHVFLELENLQEEAEEFECAQHPGLYDTYSMASNFDAQYDSDDERAQNPELYCTYSVASDSNRRYESDDDDLSGEWSTKKKRKVVDMIEEELDMESLYISQEESEYGSDAENEDKPPTPRLLRSSDPNEWRFGFTEIQTPYTVEAVPGSRSFDDNLPLNLSSFILGTPGAPFHGRTAQLVTPPDSNRGSASPIRVIRMDLDGSTSPSKSLAGSLFDDYSPPEPSTPIHQPTNWDRIMSQHFPEHAKHLCKSGRTPQAELEYIRANSGFNASFIDELDRMYPRKKKTMMEDVVMPRTGRRAPVTEKRGDFVLAEDHTATEGRSRAQLQCWSSA